MKVLVFSSLCMEFGGGVQNWIIRTLPRLTKKFGHHIVLLDSTYGSPHRLSLGYVASWAKTNGIEYRRLRVGSSFPFLGPRGAAQVRRLIYDVDVVYYDTAIASFDPWFSPIALSKPVIAGWHAPIRFPSLLHNAYVATSKRFLARLFSAHHVLNEQDQRTLLGWGCRNVHCVPLGIDTQLWKPSPDKWNSETLKITFLGRAEWQKGYDIFVETIRRFLREQRGLDIQVSILGTGSMISRSREIMDQRVSQRGFVSDPASILSESHCTILPSRVESFGNTVLEAMSCGNIVLAYPNQGSSLLIVDSNTGFIVSSEEELLKQLHWTYAMYKEQRDALRAMASRARLWVVAKFPIERHLEELNGLIKNANSY